MIWIYNLYCSAKAPKGTLIPPKNQDKDIFNAYIYKLPTIKKNRFRWKIE